jgi:hypothetical protein
VPAAVFDSQRRLKYFPEPSAQYATSFQFAAFDGSVLSDNTALMRLVVGGNNAPPLVFNSRSVAVSVRFGARLF